MNPGRLRGAIIGCGAIAPRHMAAWSRLDGVDIIAACDADAARASRLADLRAFSSVDRMLDELHGQLDFVDITTPPSSHPELIAAATRRGVHVLCQKPLAESRVDAQAILDLSRQSPAIIAVNEVWKWLPGYLWVWDSLRRGELGKPRTIRFRSASNFLLPNASGRERAGMHPRFLPMKRLVIFEYGIHVLDMLRAWFGEPLSVLARTSTALQNMQGEDAAFIHLQFKQIDAQIELDWCVAGPEVNDVLDADSLVLASDTGLLAVTGGRNVSWQPRGRTPVQVQFEGDLRDAGFKKTHAAFLAAVRGTGPVESSIEDNVKSINLMLACYESADTGARIVNPSDSAAKSFGREASAAS